MVTQIRTNKRSSIILSLCYCPVSTLCTLCAFPPCVQVFTPVWCGVTSMNRVRAFDHICRTLFLLEMQCIGQDDIFAHLHQPWKKTKKGDWNNARFCFGSSFSKRLLHCLNSYIPLDDASFSMTTYKHPTQDQSQSPQSCVHLDRKQ